MLDISGINVLALIGGFFGALGSLIWDNQRYSPKRAIGIVLMGAIGAGFLTPLVSHWLSLSNAFQGSVSFLIGLMSMRIADKLLDLIKAIPEKDLIEIIKRKFNL